MVMSLWEQVVGHLVAQKSWPEKVADGVLAIGVTSHAWAAELQLLKPEIIKRYQKLLGRSILKDITFRVGRRRASSRASSSETTVLLHPQAGERLPYQPVPPAVFEGVSNPEVREALTPFFSRLCSQRTWKQNHGWARCDSCHFFYYGEHCPYCAAAETKKTEI